MSDKMIEKFGPVLESIQTNVMMQTSWMESAYLSQPIVNENIKKQTDLLDKISETLKSSFDFSKEVYEKKETGEKLKDIPSTEPESDDGGDKNDKSSSLSVGDAFGYLTAATIAPFAISFIRGFLEEATNGLIEVTTAGVTGAISMVQGKWQKFVGKIFRPITKALDFLPESFKNVTKSLDPIRNVFANISKAFTAGVDGSRALLRNVNGTFRSINGFDKFLIGVGKIFSPIQKVFSAVTGFLSSAGGKVLGVFGALPGAGIVKLFGRLAWPLTVIMGVIDGVKEFMNTEGSFIEKMYAGIGGFLGEVIGAPLDLLKSGVAWILDKLGFEKAAEFLTSFSIEDTIKGLFKGIGGLVSDAVDWVKGLFGFGDDEENKLESDEEPGFIKRIFNGTVEKVKNFFKGAFDFIPSLEDIKSTLMSFLPSWMQPAKVEEQRKELQESLNELVNRQSSAPARSDINAFQDVYTRTKEEYDEEIADIMRKLNDLPQGRNGGIFNMPDKGGLAMLHGQEAVIPLDSSIGKDILSKKTEAIESGSSMIASQPAPVIVKGGDTVAPSTTNNNNTTTVINNSIDPSNALMNLSNAQ